MTAEGVIAVVDAAMERALRAVSVERGVDPAAWRWSPSGAPGRCTPAGWPTPWGMPAVIVPARAGVLSAVGPAVRPAAATSCGRGRRPTDHDGLAEALAELAEEAGGRRRRRSRASRPRSTAATPGQSHELTVPSVEAFDDEHWRRNGYDRPDTPVEVVALRATARRPAPAGVTDLPAPEPLPAPARADRAGRARLHGVGAAGLAGRAGAGALVLRRER